jgi:molecular chaperone Hsp33
MSAYIPAGDLLRPFQLERSQIRGRFVRLGHTIDYVLDAHAYPDPVGRLLGELLVLAGGLAGGLKFDGMFSLQIRGKGPVSLMVADCTNEGAMRGYASFDAEAVAGLDATDARSLVGGGLLALSVDQTRSGGEVWQGIVELEGTTLTDAMRTYFLRSEQVRTGIRVALLRDEVTGGWYGGAIVLQALPDKEPLDGASADDAWHEAMVLLSTASDDELADPSLAPDTVLFRLFHETGVRVFDPLRLAPGCSCDLSRVEAMLERFPAEDLSEMRLPDGSVEVTCQFCSSLYRFDPDRIAGMLESRRH